LLNITNPSLTIEEEPLLSKKLSRTVRLSGTVCAFAGLVGCSSLPNALGPSMLHPHANGQFRSQAVPGKVLVKLKSNATTMSVQSLSMVQAIPGLPGTRVYAVPSGASMEDTLARLRQDPNVAYAEPDYVYHAIEDTSATVPSVSSQLWGMEKIQAPQAWATSEGSPNVVVAVVDTGVDYNHEDLKDQVIKGPNLVANTADPMDDQGHGSHVAGTIAGIGVNGVYGVAFKTKILAIKVLGSDGSGDTATIAQGILKANELGAKVINLSLGGPDKSQTLEDAVNTVNGKGTLVVCAAGNDGNTGVDYPAGFASSLAVGATDQNDQRASFSNYGSYVAIAAPGVGIYSSTGGSYKEESGTSMASPHVAGSAALLLAVNPNLTNDQLKSALENNGDTVTGFENGNLRRLNVARAIASLAGGATPTPAQPAPTPAPAQPDPGATAAPSFPDPGTPAPADPGNPGNPADPGNGAPGYYPPGDGGPGYYPNPYQPPRWGQPPHRRHRRPHRPAWPGYPGQQDGDTGN